MHPVIYIVGVVAVLGAVFMPRIALGYIKGVPVKLTVADIGGGKVLRADAAAEFDRMQRAALSQGVPLRVNSAFRTMQEQESLWERYMAGEGNIAAKPGFSNHQNGLAVDIEVQRSTRSVTYKWLAENAATYGFDNAEGSRIGEPWHWVYTRGLS